jgi:ubiquinone/menaquinone biosynthesis C-methylase UbiE
LTSNHIDWIVIVDVLHDLPNPDQCLAEVKRVLKDDGIVSAIDPAFHSDQKMNVGDPNAPMLYVFSTFICLPCSMSAEPAVGHGVGWGMENRVAFLKAREFKILGAEAFDRNGKLGRLLKQSHHPLGTS